MGDRSYGVCRVATFVGLAAMAVALALPIVAIEGAGGRLVPVYGGEWLMTALATGVWAVCDELAAFVAVHPDARSPYDQFDLLGATWFFVAVFVGVAAVMRGRASMRRLAVMGLVVSLAGIWLVSLFASGDAPCPFVLHPWGPCLRDRHADWSFASGHWTWLVGATLVLLAAIAREDAAFVERRRWALRPWGPPTRTASCALAELSLPLRRIHEQAQRIREELARDPYVSTPTADLLWGLASDLVALDVDDVRHLEDRGVATQRVRAELVGEVATDANGDTAIAEAMRRDAALERLCTRMTTQRDRGSPFRGAPTR